MQSGEISFNTFWVKCKFILFYKLIYSSNARALFTVIIFTKWILPLKKNNPQKMADKGFDEISLSSQTYLKALTISK